jgi:hypothetical protein
LYAKKSVNNHGFYKNSTSQCASYKKKYLSLQRQNIISKMNDNTHKDMASEPIAMTYGMSADLRNSGLLNEVQNLSREDKHCLVRYLYDTNEDGLNNFEELNDNQQPYTMEELNARIDEAEEEIERGEGKSFDEMMAGFRKELLWLS